MSFNSNFGKWVAFGPSHHHNPPAQEIIPSKNEWFILGPSYWHNPPAQEIKEKESTYEEFFEQNKQ